jgi:hypothetical protein
LRNAEFPWLRSPGLRKLRPGYSLRKGDGVLCGKGICTHCRAMRAASLGLTHSYDKIARLSSFCFYLNCCCLSKKPSVVGLHGLPFFYFMFWVIDRLKAARKTFPFNDKEKKRKNKYHKKRT